MTISKISKSAVDTIKTTESVRSAAERMRQRGVGSLVVLSEKRHVVGMITDRDIVLRAVAEGMDPSGVTVGDVMTRNAETIAETTPIEDALGLMRSAKVRRLVVVDGADEMTGVVTLDDILAFIAEEFSAIGRLVSEQTAPT